MSEQNHHEPPDPEANSLTPTTTADRDSLTSKKMEQDAPMADTTAEAIANSEAEATGNDLELKKTETQQYPPTLTVLTIMISLLMSMFLIALDRTIISTAIPRITDEFSKCSQFAPTQEKE